MNEFIRLSVFVTAVLTLIATTNAQTELGPSRAILNGLPDNARVEITLGKEFKTISSPPTVALYAVDKDKNEVEVASLPSAMAAPYRTFQIAFPAQYKPDLSYEVLVIVHSVNESGAPITLKKVIKVEGLYTVDLLRVGGCSGVRMVIRSPLRGEAIWQPIFNWLDQFNGANARKIATVNFKVVEDPNEVEYFVENLVWKRTPLVAEAGQLRICLEFDKPLPSKDFNATFIFHGPNLPPNIGTITGEELSAAFAIALPKDEELDSPDKRGFERNLDLGVTFTSEVANESVQATSTISESILRKRTNRGVLDVRFAPWLDVLHPVFKANRWLHHLTPVFINANVATGKIEKETLGLNRILIGIEGESRYVHKREFEERLSGGKVRQRETYPFWHRVVWGGTHASDRDFKQKEFTGKLEYYPVIDRFYRPYTINYSIDNDGFKHQRFYGFTLLPVVGGQIGRTYSRRNPAPAVKPSETVKRFYFGGEATVDFTNYITLSFYDTFYVRRENPQDYYKNYFKGAGEFRLGRSRNRDFSHSLFIIYERGQQPPFASPDANSFRVGYRIRGSYCGEHCR